MAGDLLENVDKQAEVITTAEGGAVAGVTSALKAVPSGLRRGAAAAATTGDGADGIAQRLNFSSAGPLGSVSSGGPIGAVGSSGPPPRYESRRDKWSSAGGGAAIASAAPKPSQRQPSALAPIPLSEDTGDDAISYAPPSMGDGSGSAASRSRSNSATRNVVAGNDIAAAGEAIAVKSSRNATPVLALVCANDAGAPAGAVISTDVTSLELPAASDAGIISADAAALSQATAAAAIDDHYNDSASAADDPYASLAAHDPAVLITMLKQKDALVSRLSKELESNASAAERAGAREASLLKELHHLDGAASALQHEVDRLTSVNATLTSSLEAAQAESGKAASHAAGLEAQINDAYAEVSQYRGVIEGLKQELRNARAEADPAAIEAARAEAEQLRARLTSLQADYDSARTAHAGALAAARGDVMRAEAAAEAAVSEAHTARRAAVRREEELSGEISELSAALAAAQRLADERGAALRAAQASSGSAELEAYLRRESSAAAEAAVSAERASATALRADVESLTRQLTSARDMLEGSRKALAEARVERDTSVAQLTAKVASLQARIDASNAAALEARLQGLADSLVARQGALDAALAEASALRHNLEAERVAHAQTREALQSAREELRSVALGASGGIDDISGGGAVGTGLTSGSGLMDASDVSLDIESSGGAGFSTPVKGSSSVAGASGGAVARRRPGAGGAGAGGGAFGAVTPISKLPPMIQLRAHAPEVAKAADTVDRAFVRSGRYLFSNPAARLGAIGYLLVLHLWSLFILLFHTHSLSHDAHSHGAMPRKPG